MNRKGAEGGLAHGPPGPHALHLCVDMQRLFATGAWAVPWLPRILPKVAAVTAHAPQRTVFTRFLPPENAEAAGGMWRPYYRKWAEVTLDRMGEEPTRLLSELERFTPPARVVDKAVYSPWLAPDLPAILQEDGIDTLILTGGETDVCVLATVLGAIDRGYRTILVTDALCSSSDSNHDRVIDLYDSRFSIQIETVTTAELLSLWRV